MFNAWWALSADLIAANMAAQRVIAHRLVRMAEGGLAADREMRRMIVEKIVAQTEFNLGLVQGKSMKAAIRGVQAKIHANDRRLRKPRKRRKA